MDSNNPFKFIPSTNKNQTPFHKLSSEKLFQAIIKKDRIALARAITLVESQLASDRQLADDLLARCLQDKKTAFVLAISGPPGVGKSTFIDAFGSTLVDQGRSVAVLTIDPSSQRTGGSILGDKTRMERLSCHPAAFVRPSPAKKNLGGVTQSTQEAIWICEAAGFDIIIVETVGIGQSETAVRNMVDCFLLLLPPVGGDDLQGVKRGVMEMADIIVITKADGVLEKQASKMLGLLKPLLPLLHAATPGWTISLCKVSSLQEAGFENIMTILEQFQAFLAADDVLQNIRTAQLQYWFDKTLESRILELFYKDGRIHQEVLKVHQQLTERLLSPFEAVENILNIYRKGNS